MASRGQRLAAALTTLAVLLFAGRWTSEFFADQWWAGSVAPGVRLLLARRAILGLALDCLGVLAAGGWFVLQVRLAWRTLGELGPRERGGNPVIRRALQRPGARSVALAGAILLGILVGSGLSNWADGVLLALAGVHYGVPDAAIGSDLGFYVARLPLLSRFHAFATLLILSALGLVALLLLVTGGVRIGRGRLAITDAARRHLGLLLALLALSIGASKVLEPYQLAVGIPTTLTLGAIRLHRSVAMVLVGMSLAVAALSLIWTRRPTHTLTAGAWFALSGSLVLANWLLPADRPDDRDSEHRLLRRQAEAIAFGIEFAGLESRPADRWEFSLWGDTVLARGREDREQPSWSRRSEWRDTSGWHPARVVLARTGDGSQRLLAVRDDTVGTDGAAVPIGSPTEDIPLHAPGAPSVVVGQEAGVLLGSTSRRVALAWALQRASLLGGSPVERVGWYLDPVERLGHGAPFADWRDPTPRLLDGRLHWLVDGYVLAEAFPGTERLLWFDRMVGAVGAGFLGVVDDRTGVAQIFLRPGADSLAHAWARVADGLVRPSDELAPELRERLGYPRALLAAQGAVMARRAGAGLPGVALVQAMLGPGPEAGSEVVPIVRPGDRLHSLLIGRHLAGADALVEIQPDSAERMEGRATLARRWQRMAVYQAVRDSVIASGGALVADSARYLIDRSGLLAYQPYWAVTEDGTPRLAMMAMAQGDRLSMGRSAQQALTALATGAMTRQRMAGDESVLEAIRRLVGAADSALARGDVAEFGALFAQLRELLRTSADSGSPR